jgi:integrase
MAQPTYFEKTLNAKGKASYLFVKRLNPKAGNFPLFMPKAKLKMMATSDAEATREAKALVADLDLLQEVARKDGRHITSTKDKNKAAETWVRVVAGVDLPALRSLKGRNTKEAVEASEILSYLIDEVVGHYETRALGHEGEIKSWLTDFGDHLFKFLKDGQGVGSITEGVEIYLRQTQRDHLDEKVSSVRTAHRVVAYFVEIVGDKQLDQISRKDVERYVTTRLEKVKTTSVLRELRSLSALWNKCAQVLDLQQLNPFANQPIKGIGSDSVERHTPSVKETQDLLQVLQTKAVAAPDSYVWPLVAVSALTGLRLSEAWGLVRADLIQEDATLWVRPNFKRTSLKTANSQRPIPVLTPLAGWLERYFLSVEKSGGAKNANSASASCVKALKRLGFTFGCHSLRHGMKQRLTEADAPSNLIDELMGWSNQSMARNYGRNVATTAKRNLLATVYNCLEVGISVEPEDERNSNVLQLNVK